MKSKNILFFGSENSKSFPKKGILALAVGLMLITMSAVVIANGFDEFGYNRKARNFVGTCISWHMGKFGSTEAEAIAYCGDYSYDKLVMKWNAEWDRGNDEGWANPPYDAWENNNWNGMCDGCSGEVWHYKIKWVGDCNSDPSLLPEGSYCIWGQFATIMDQGTSGGEHIWLTHGIPTGYGN